MFLPVLIMLAMYLPGTFGMLLGHTCSPAEYEVMGECCPMCNPGYHVIRHCTEYTSTTCAPCPPSTYTDAHSGLVSCRRCTVCDSSAGLRLKMNCSSTSDTLCEPLEGHYCTDPIKDGCRGAVGHTKCLPGQYIKQKGTASSDTVCSECVGKTYSDGSFTSCRPHTQCEVGYNVAQEGTSSSDTECQMISGGVGIAVSLLITAILLFTVTVVIKKRIHVKKKKKEPDPSLCSTSSTLGASTNDRFIKRNEKDPKRESGGDPS